MEDVEEQTQRLLVMKDSESRTVIGHADECALKINLSSCRTRGPSIRSVIQCVVSARDDQITGTEHSPVVSSGRNGIIQRTNKEGQHQIWTRSAVVHGTGSDIRGFSQASP